MKTLSIKQPWAWLIVQGIMGPIPWRGQLGIFDVPDDVFEYRLF